jgi:uncharacterized protein YwgA
VDGEVSRKACGIVALNELQLGDVGEIEEGREDREDREDRKLIFLEIEKAFNSRNSRNPEIPEIQKFQKSRKSENQNKVIQKSRMQKNYVILRKEILFFDGVPVSSGAGTLSSSGRAVAPRNE